MYLFIDRLEYSMCKEIGCWFDDRVLIPGLARSVPSSSHSNQLCITPSPLRSVFGEMFLQWRSIRRKTFAHLWNSVHCRTLSGLSHVSYTAWRSGSEGNYLQILLNISKLIFAMFKALTAILMKIQVSWAFARIRQQFCLSLLLVSSTTSYLHLPTASQTTLANLPAST
jgi:hypothetical protein